jgi:hypothetical protein
MLAVALSQLDGLAGSLAEIIKFGSPRLAAADRLDVDDIGRMKREDSLYSLIGYYSPDGEHLIDASAFAGDYRAGEHLNPFFVAFLDFATDVYHIAYLEIGHFFLQAFAFNGIQ